MPPPPPRPVLFNPLIHAHLLPQFAQIHADCILLDDTLATFLPSREDRSIDVHGKVLNYWRERAEQVAKGTRMIVFQYAAPNEDDQLAVVDGEKEVAGYVSLNMDSASETGPFRGSVEKLMVSPRHRRKGVARAVMEKLEAVAIEEGSTLLVLDTTIGTPAEHLYPKLGYVSLGVIPGYGISPKDGKLVDEIFFYKDLRQPKS